MTDDKWSSLAALQTGLTAPFRASKCTSSDVKVDECQATYFLYTFVETGVKKHDERRNLRPSYEPTDGNADVERSGGQDDSRDGGERALEGVDRTCDWVFTTDGGPLSGTGRLAAFGETRSEPLTRFGRVVTRALAPPRWQRRCCATGFAIGVGCMREFALGGTRGGGFSTGAGGGDPSDRTL